MKSDLLAVSTSTSRVNAWRNQDESVPENAKAGIPALVQNEVDVMEKSNQSGGDLVVLVLVLMRRIGRLLL